MTVICVKNGIMAADSHTFSRGTKWESAFPKITRGPKGLIGVAGSSVDAYMIAQWWKAGGLAGATPHLGSGDEGPAALILLNDGTVWFMDDRLKPCPMSDPAVTGEMDAATFTEGALRAGLSAEDAVRLATKHCKSAGGEVQVERLEQSAATSLPGLSERIDLLPNDIGRAYPGI